MLKQSYILAPTMGTARIIYTYKNDILWKLMVHMCGLSSCATNEKYKYILFPKCNARILPSSYSSFFLFSPSFLASAKNSSFCNFFVLPFWTVKLKLQALLKKFNSLVLGNFNELKLAVL